MVVHERHIISSRGYAILETATKPFLGLFNAPRWQHWRLLPLAVVIDRVLSEAFVDSLEVILCPKVQWRVELFGWLTLAQQIFDTAVIRRLQDPTANGVRVVERAS